MKTFLNLLLLVAITFCTLGNARVIKSLEDLTLTPATGSSVIISSPSITANQPLKFGAAKEITSGLIDLTSDVTGILPVTEGGTGTSATAHTNLTTNVTGILPVANGGTGSATQNYVDLTSNQAVSGTKTFNNKFSVVSTTEPSIPCPTQTTTQRNAVGSPVTGDCVYNSTTSALNVYNGSSWVAVGSGGGGGIAEWVTSTGYSIDDVIFTDDKIYVALTNHTAGTFATDLTNNEWSELSPVLTNAQVKTAYELNADTNALTDAFVTKLNATSGTNTGDLSNVQIKTNYEANADTNALTDAALVILGNTSGTNTGDQDLSTLMTNPLTTTGDIVYATSGTTAGRLAIGTDAQVLTLASGVPTWASPAASGVGSGGSSTDNALPRWDGTAGDTLQDSSVLLSDLDALTGITSVYVSGSDASVIPFTIRGANQTANFLEVETHDGTNVLEVDSAGVLRTALRSSTSDGFSIAPIGGATNHGIIFNGTGNNSNVTLRAANSAYMTLSGNGVLISGVGVYAIRSGTRGVSTAPAYTFDNDRDTGIFSNSANLLSMSSGTVVALTTSATEVQAKLPLELANNASATTPPSGEISIHNDSEVLKVTNDAGIKRRVSHFEPRDVFTNPSFEDSTVDNGWTITSGTATAELTTIVPSEGEQALELAVSASAFEMYQTFDCSDYDAIPLGFSAYVSATPSSELEICGFDGTTDLNCTSLYTSSTSTAILGYQKVLAENTGGGTCGIKIKSDATITETIHIDGVEFTDMPYRFVDVQNTTEWVTYDLTIGAVTTPPTEGTVSYHNARWRRVGDSMEIHWEYKQTAAGSAGSGVYLLPIPSDYVIDSTKLTPSNGAQTISGVGWVSNTATGTGDASRICAVGAYDTSNLKLECKTSTDSTVSFGTSYGSLATTNVVASFKATVPIVGWSATSSNVVTPTKSNLSNWTAFTPVLTGFGTVTGAVGHYRRIGDSMHVRGSFISGTPTAATAEIDIPAGEALAISKIGSGNMNRLGTSNNILTSQTITQANYTHIVFSDKVDTSAVFIGAAGDSVAATLAKVNGNSIIVLGQGIVFDFIVPIEGWSGEDYFLSMFPKDRFQTKLLSADVTTTTDISDLQFDNLKIGTVYNIGGIVYATQDSSIEVQAYSAASGGGTNYGIVHYSTQAGTDVIGTGAGVNNTFTAVSTSLFFRVINPFSETVAGDNTNTETHITLTERNTTIETDQF